MTRIATLIVALSLFLLVDGAVHTADAFPTGRFIDARSLTQVEHAAVERLIRFTGKKPWLIFGFRFGTNPEAGRDRVSLNVFLEPDAESGRLRRGRVVAMAFAQPKSGQPLSWHVESVTRYAHVAVAGRAAADVIGRWDVDMPFSVPDDLDDATILSLVDFIRTSPERSDLPSNVGPRRVDGSIAIIRISRTSNGLQVDMQGKPWQGWKVLVDQDHAGWVVRQVWSWIN